MNTKSIWLSLIGVIISFIGGFLLANALNRSEINQLRSEFESRKLAESGSAQSQNKATLSDEEIHQRISEADQSPTNLKFQKDLGMALYLYAGERQNADLLGEVVRLLDRVYQDNPKDFDVLIALGNSSFDIGLLKKENENLQKARKFYLEALEINQKDVELRTALGLSFLLSIPAETGKAIEEFEKSLNENPNHEKTLRAISQAYISQRSFNEAEKYLAQLQKVNPQNPHLSELQDQLQNERNSAETK